MPSKDALKIARYCSSLARSSRSAALVSVTSRPMYSTCGCPWCWIGTPRTSMWNADRSLRRATDSQRTCSPASARWCSAWMRAVISGSLMVTSWRPSAEARVRPLIAS